MLLKHRPTFCPVVTFVIASGDFKNSFSTPREISRFCRHVVHAPWHFDCPPCLQRHHFSQGLFRGRLKTGKTCASREDLPESPYRLRGFLDSWSHLCKPGLTLASRKGLICVIRLTWEKEGDSPKAWPGELPPSPLRGEASAVAGGLSDGCSERPLLGPQFL